MTNKEIIDRAITLRQQVIDGGKLYHTDVAVSSFDIVNSVNDFMAVLSRVDVYDVRPPVKKKQIPFTKEDLNSRFDSGKTMRMTGPYGSFTITSWWFTELVISYVSGGIDTIKYNSDILLKSKFINGDPCYKGINE